MELDYVDHTTVGTVRCSHNNRFVLETKTRIDGSVRRRYQCRDCGERWTVINVGEKPGREPLKPIPKHPPYKLTLDQVYRALTETQVSQKRMAAELGVSRQCIQLVRAGVTWPNAFPEIPRKVPRRSCEKCRNWSDGECRIGFPDPLEEGTGFAADCDFYEV
jgi:transposase-like protein